LPHEEDEGTLIEREEKKKNIWERRVLIFISSFISVLHRSCARDGRGRKEEKRKISKKKGGKRWEIYRRIGGHSQFLLAFVIEVAVGRSGREGEGEEEGKDRGAADWGKGEGRKKEGERVPFALAFISLTFTHAFKGRSRGCGEKVRKEKKKEERGKAGPRPPSSPTLTDSPRLHPRLRPARQQ